MFYGLDVFTLSNSEIQKLNQFHKTFLKQVMHLHERTADTAVYILSGQLPLVADLHKRVLGTLGSVLRSYSIERELAERQILLEDKKSKSWSVYVCPILSKYYLPSTIYLLNTEISKEAWKQTVDKHVSAYWVDKIKLEASEKSSLKFLNTQNYKIGEVHYLWKSAGFNLMAIKKAGLKAKLMTGTYVPQSNRAKFNQYSVDPTCLLCGDDAEDMIQCRCLLEPRDQFMEKISSILIEYQGTKELKEIFKDFDLLAALILDCTAINLKASETHREDLLHKFESVFRGLCYALHCRRFSLLNNVNN